ncbi:malate oxidoreductase domain protein [Brevibacillus laterosporus GI-9]|nr:malate oxidoreductase domain protein [Brevibacillus laterosporus GI-9]
MVYSYTLLGSLKISLQGSATPGEYARLKSCASRTGTFVTASSFP